ncbi:MAG TPA: type II toxin-antitoxin system HicA family toxin [Patescibacteria group bacterium]
MPRRYSSDEILKVLRRQGFIFVSQKGSHVKYCKLGPRAYSNHSC